MLGPIFVREWLTVPRRSRHYVIRAAYLGILWVLALTAWQAMVGWSRPATLGDTARFGMLVFQLFTFVQLTLLLFFAALSAAGAITQEKDRRTFILLLLTDLRNYEIVLGKLLGSLLQILLLLASTVPVLAMIMLLGGVALHQVAEAVLVLAATGLAAGSLGLVIALWRDRTFQSLALTVLFLVLYVCLVRGLTFLPSSLVKPDTVATVQTWMDPFLALQSVLEPPRESAAPPVTAEEELPEDARGTTSTQAAVIPPAVGFAGVMLSIAVGLNVLGIARLRVWNPSGEPIMQREAPDAEEDEKLTEEKRARAHAAPGAVREVWANPILWREVRTRAYGRRPLLVKTAYYLVIALICWYVLAPLTLPGEPDAFAAAYGIVPVAILSLLLVAAQAVTAITSERDTGALDLLLVTDLSPQEFIFGKVLGILWNTKEFLWPPLVLACVYAFLGLLATPPRGRPQLLAYVNGESLVCVLGVLIVLLAFALVLGLHVALRNHNTRQAILNTLGTIFFLSVGTLIAVYLILINGQFEYQWASFVFFIMAGVGGLWWVLSGDRPSAALTLAAWMCPVAVFYSLVNIILARPGSTESADPLIPFVVLAGAFGFTVAAMLIPLVSEFDVALGRTTAGGE